jgi:hypothetical protein
MSALIRSIIEDKFSTYISTNIPGILVNKGITPDLRQMPMIIVYAASAAPERDLGANPMGNYSVKVEIYVYSSADDDTLESHRNRVSMVHGLMSNVDILKDLWGTNEGQLYACWIESDDEGMKGRNYGNLITYTAVAVLPPQV